MPESAGSRSENSCLLAIKIQHENLLWRAIHTYTGSSLAAVSATGTAYTVRGDECRLYIGHNDSRIGFGRPGIPIDLDGELTMYYFDSECFSRNAV
jgi:hypothetical protein